MTDVFISYSRKDKDFVKALHTALAESGHDAWVDWQDIPLTADWWNEIERGIEAADTFVFVLSSDSVGSTVCYREVEHAVQNNKRLVPIVRRDDFSSEQVHPALKRHNWLFFQETNDFDHSFRQLIEAIATDLEHVKQHTRILVRAIEWDRKARDESFVLRGSDLEEAKQWLQQAAAKDPQPSTLQAEYIQTSQKVEEANLILLRAGQKARRMVRLGAGVMGIMLAIAAISAILAQQRIQAANQEVQTVKLEVDRTKKDATEQTQKAQKNVNTAKAKQVKAERNVKQAQQQLTQAKSNLGRVNQQAAQQVLVAAQKVQLAETKTNKAQQAAARLNKSSEKAQADANAAQRAVAEKTAALSTLDNQLKQAQYQINLSQQAITESIGDTPTRIAEQTGQTPAIIYASFVPTSEDGQAQDSDPLGILLITPKGPRRFQIPEATRAEVIKTGLQFRRQVSTPRFSQQKLYLEPAQKLYEWLFKELEPELQKQNTKTLVFLLDPSLRSLPLSALYDGKQFLVERYSIGLMPGFSLTDTRPTNLKTAPVLAMGISEGIADLPPLPGVEVEVKQIMQLRKGKQFLNQESTLTNLKAQMQNHAYKILHLATHAEFYPGSPDKSYIQLWDTKIRLNQLDEVGLDNYPVDLLVLSSCRTGLGDDRDKYGFAGLAIQVGVRAVLASIWYISDEATTALMTDFYRQLQSAPTKAEALRMAQLAMLKGRIKPEATTTRGDGVVQPTTTGIIPIPIFGEDLL